MKITFDWLEANKYPSVTDYCRDLVDAKSPVETLEVYRGEMLCLTVDVKRAAKLMPSNCRWIKYDKRRNRDAVEPQGEV